MSIIDKPEENTVGEYKKFFAELKDTYGLPEYVIGVTFGVDLQKWRIILKELFGKEFQEKKLFDKAYLFTDKVSIVDSNKNRDLLKGNLRYSIPKVKGYLHTKFILLKYKDKYILAVSSKNIANSTSYDMVLPFISEKKKQEEEGHGKKIYDFLKYLEMPNIEETLENIKECNFSPVQGNGKVTDFEIAYNDKRFSEKLWNSVCSCNLIISPFLEKEVVEKIDEIAKENNQEVKLLAYPKQISKVLGDDCKSSGIKFYMGKVVEGKNGKQEFIFQRRFHVKLYVKIENENTRVYFGSANLTSKAMNNHCEMLLGLEFEGKSEEYSAIDNMFASDLTEEYDQQKALPMDEEEDDIWECSEFNGAISYEDKIYVSETPEGYILNVVKKQEDKWEFKTTWGKPYFKPVYFVVDDDKMFCIEKELYLDNATVKEFEGALTYDEYIQKTEHYLKQLKKESDWNVLMGENMTSRTRRVGSKNGKSTKVNKVPCFYNALFQQLALQNNNLKADISKEKIKAALEGMKELLYEEENIQFVEKMIDQLGEGNNKR